MLTYASLRGFEEAILLFETGVSGREASQARHWRDPVTQGMEPTRRTLKSNARVGQRTSLFTFSVAVTPRPGIGGVDHPPETIPRPAEIGALPAGFFRADSRSLRFLRILISACFGMAASAAYRSAYAWPISRPNSWPHLRSIRSPGKTATAPPAACLLAS